MYMYEIYTFYMPSTLPGVLHMLCNLILIIALCDTHIYFYFKNGKNETLAGYLICRRSKGKEMEMPYLEPGVFDSKVMLFSFQNES